MISTTRCAAMIALAGASLLAIPIVADAALVDLGAIAECDIQEAACPDEDYQQFELRHDEHWRLREQINGIVATTIEGLRVKAGEGAGGDRVQGWSWNGERRSWRRDRAIDQPRHRCRLVA